MISLYEFALSGNCHKVRLMLALLGQEYRSVLVNGQQKEHKSAAFLSKNPFGQVPVLQDGETTIRDSQAILVYLARTYGAEHWLPKTPAAMAEVVAWLSTAANEVTRGPNALRANHKFGRAINPLEAEIICDSLLDVLQSQLNQQYWLVNPSMTNGNCSITRVNTGSKNASLIPSTQDSTCHCVMQSTQVM